jgi:hypothetical protein
VTKEQVHVIEIQTLQRAVDALHEILAVECILFIDARVQTPEQFGRNQVTAASPAQLPRHRPHQFLGTAACAGFRVVEEIYPVIQGIRHQRNGGFDAEASVKGHP